MKTPEIPNNEKERLNALRNFGILDTESEKSYRQIVELAQLICGTQIAIISLIDENRQWFKEKIGLDVDETPRSVSFCGHAILQDDIFEVQNALLDTNFNKNPLVTGDPNIRFYAGAPLKTTEGYNVGTICVIDNQPKQLNDKQKSALKLLSNQIVSLFEFRKEERINSFAKYMMNVSQEGAAIYNDELEVLYANEKAYQLLKLTKDQFYGRTLYSSKWKVIDLYGKVVPPENFPISHCFKQKKDIRDVVLGVYDDQDHVNWITVDAIYNNGISGEKPNVFGKWRSIENDISKIKNKELQVLGIENLQEGIVVHDQFDKIVGYNDAALKMLKLTADQIDGKSSFDPMWKTIYEDGSVFPPEKHPSAIVIRTSKSVNNVILGVVTGKEKTTWLKVNASPVFAKDNQGKKTTILLGAMVTLEDVSSELIINRKLELMSKAVQNLSSPVAITNNTGLIEFINPAFTKLFGFEAKELIGKPISILKSGEHGVDFYKRMWMSLLKGEKFEAELVNKSKNGNLIVQEISINAVFSGDTVVNYVAVYSNLEETKMMVAFNKRMEEKDLLMKEIHHRVKNNLQVISSLLALQETQSNKGNSDNIQQILQKAQMRINSIALLHEKLYQNNNIVSVDISSYLKDLSFSISEQIKTDNTGIKIVCEVEQYQVAFERLIPFGLIFNEIITNSFKYAFPDNKGLISVKGFVSDGQFNIVIYDDGIGAPSKAFLQREGSLGTKLIAILVKQLKGTIAVNTSPGKGVSYTITFKVN